MECVDIVGELQTLPDNVHLLCPRQHDEDHARYDDPNQVDESGRPVAELVTDATVRREKFLSSMRILAYSEDGVEELQKWIWRRLGDALERCDVCIKQYYIGKVWLMERLKEDYDDDDIERFSQMLDEWDIKRITKNLARATAKLKEVPPQEIGIHVLDRPSLLSIFESLSCDALLRNEDLLREYFDEPFRLIQTKRSLKVPDYIPAVTRFLLDSNQGRSFWAINSWMRYSRPPTTMEFDWAIKDGLLDMLRLASQQPPQIAVIQRLWRGMQLVVKKLDKDQITHNLRALEIDPCRLSVEHLSIPAPSLRFLLNTIQTFLEKAPVDFWDAMQTISPQAIIEQVFYNPQLDNFLAQENDSYEKSPLKDMLSWITPFMSSLQGAQQPSACRFLSLQLLSRLQEPRFSSFARYHCYHSGLLTVLQTLRSFTDHESSRGSVKRVVLSETLGVVSEHISKILDPPKFGDQKDPVISSLCMDVIRNTLALECQSLKTDYEFILRNGVLHDGVSTYSAPIWDAVVRHLDEDNLALSTSALLGILPVVGLEKFPTRGETCPAKTHFNVIYGHLTHLSCQVIERLADFHPEHVDELFRSQDTSSALISALFAADLNTYQAAVDLIKNVSGQSARRDAISHLLQSFFTTTMYGLSWSFRRISNMKTFASAPRMIHTGTDIVDILCDSQTGMLRTRKLADRREILCLQKLWEYLWQALTVIFDNTEKWHAKGNDKSLMLEFCRDTIQFADLLFSQYSIFLGAVVDADQKQGHENLARENFLKPPTATMSAMVKWLRLKDEYLATTLVGLVSKLLRRLGELSVTTVREDALQTIEKVAVESSIRTILTPRDKAELVRALEAYYKKPVVTASTAGLKKQSSITAFAKSAEASATSSPDLDDDVPDDVLLDLSRSVELNKERLAAQAKKPAKPLPAISRPPAPSPLKSNASVLSFREKRGREKEAKKKRDMAELARLKKNLPATGVAEQTAEQGSGLNGIGVQGKDHTPAESMMVSSGSESESESEDELDEELFGPNPKRPSKPDAVKEYEESKRLSLKRQQGPVKKIKQARSAKDMRARLAPDLSSLHRTILSWDFFANGDLPPSSGRTDYSLVSNTFRNPTEYQRTFEPLLVLEAWQGFQSSKEEGIFKPFEIKIATRLSVDSFVEVSTVMPSTEVKDYGLGEADIVLLSTSARPEAESSAPHCLARVAGINRKKANVEVSYRVNPGSPFIRTFAPGVVIWGTRITSLTPLEREYGALMALQYYDLCEEIVKAKPSPILGYSDASLKPIAENYKLNPAQAKAIKSAMDNDAFTLIQGPPGSGKTKTIVALVGALMSGALASQGVAIRPTGMGNSNSRPTKSRKLLVCAPSNAAVDELVMRFKQGVKTIQGREEKLSVIRLGRSDAINANVLDVTLDELVNARLSQNNRKDGGERDLQKIYMEHKTTDTAFKDTRTRIDQCRAQGRAVPSELEREFDLLKKKKTQLSQEIDNARDKNHSAARDADLTRRRIQQEIIDGAHVICATLSGSGHEMFQNLSIEFETVVIDEAAQSIELSALIPLKYGCSKCILVGDPKQLPPTVLSKVASRFQYEQSLFVRMQSNHSQDVHLLDTQYRMHPEISAFPSAAFYDGKLQDGPNMRPLRASPWHQSEHLSPYRFFDVQGLHQSAAKGHSLINVAEVRVAMQLYDRLLTDFRGYDFHGKIGIITPYKGQLREMKAQFASKYGSSILNMVEFNTTDAFQGRESDVIIFSCVRASNKGIGFLADIRRMNVGLTRAKSSLWVLGNSQSLSQGEFWNKLVSNARQRNLYTDGDILKLLQRPQFTGYRNVEMADADAPMPPSNGPSGEHVARAPSTSLENQPSGSPKPTAVPAPANRPPLPDGPSGGFWGLDDNKMCGYCGSYEHMTHACDNIDAMEASRGTCHRCGNSGHTRRDCTAPRCTDCGQFGHVNRECTSKQPLSKQEKSRIARYEHHHAKMQSLKAQRQRNRQLGGHDPKVPVIQTTTESPRPDQKKPERSNPDNGPGKRKLSRSPPPGAPKAARQQGSDSQRPGGAPKSRRKTDNNRPPPPKLGDLVKPSRDGPAYAPLNNNNPLPGPRGPDNSKNPPPPGPHRGSKKPGNNVRPPMLIKSKDADPFIRPKRR